MPQYASFDSTITGVSPVTGWYPSNYGNVPATNLLELTDAQWAARMTGRWAVENGALVPYVPPPLPIDYAALAKVELDKSDVTVIRCVEHGVTVPAEWTAYRASLRDIVNGTSVVTALPTAPTYPAGT